MVLQILISSLQILSLILLQFDGLIFIYGRQLVKKAAKLFLGSQPGINDWDALKEALQIWRKAYRKKTQKESLIEYFYSMTALANQSKLDVEIIIEYIVEDIPDSRQNKSCL